jgi:hypothetical protein
MLRDSLLVMSVNLDTRLHEALNETKAGKNKRSVTPSPKGNYEILDWQIHLITEVVN